MQKKCLFSSERPGFRSWHNDDLDEVAELNADPQVVEHFPSTLSRGETADFIDRLIAHFNRHGYSYFAVEVIDTGELIGFIGLAYQTYGVTFLPATVMGWRLKQTAWGKGYATEDAKRCLEFDFQKLKLERVVSTCTLSNQNSENVMRKIGLTKMGEFDHPRPSASPGHERCVWYEVKKSLS